MIVSSEDNSIIFRISKDQIQKICEVSGLDLKTAEEYQVCEALNKMIDSFAPNEEIGG